MMKNIIEKLTHFIPDELYIKIRWYLRMRTRLNLKEPKTFNEKLQWLKLYNHNPLYTKLADKYSVREYVKQTIGEEYLIPLLGVYNSFAQIDFDELPEQFVLKCNHDSGGLVICRDKKALDLDYANKKITKCLRHNFYWHTREWAYKNIEPKIIAEKYMTDGSLSANGKTDLKDYKFFCFNGKPRFFYVSVGMENHKTAKISFYDLQGNPMPFKRLDYNSYTDPLDLPSNFKQMCCIAQKLAEGTKTPFVRIDLYSIENRIFFSEFTFYPCSGMMPFEPKEWDGIIGTYFDVGEN